MKKVAIYGQAFNTNALKEVLLLLNVLQEKNIVVFFEKQFYELYQKGNLLPKNYPTFSHFNDLNNSFDLFFTIGGDGTILRSVTFIRNLNIPVLGINTVRLCFLATIQKDEIKHVIELLLLKESKVPGIKKVKGLVNENDLRNLVISLVKHFDYIFGI